MSISLPIPRDSATHSSLTLPPLHEYPAGSVRAKRRKVFRLRVWPVGCQFLLFFAHGTAAQIDFVCVVHYMIQDGICNVGSPTASCQWAIGNWLVITVIHCSPDPVFTPPPLSLDIAQSDQPGSRISSSVRTQYLILSNGYIFHGECTPGKQCKLSSAEYDEHDQPRNDAQDQPHHDGDYISC